MKRLYLLRDKQDFNKIRPNIKSSIWEKDDDLSQIDEKLYYHLNSSGVSPETFYCFTEL